MNKKIKIQHKIVGLLLSSTIFMVSVSNVLAYNLNPWARWKEPKALTYYFTPGVSTDIKNAVLAGAGAWNSSYSGIALMESTSDGSIIIGKVTSTSGYYYNTEAITFQPTVDLSGYATRQTINFNSAYPQYLNNLDSAKSVACHEFGHVLGLNEISPNNAVLMNQVTWGTGSRWEGYGINTPQSDDISGVKYIY